MKNKRQVLLDFLSKIKEIRFAIKEDAVYITATIHRADKEAIKVIVSHWNEKIKYRVNGASNKFEVYICK